MRKNEKGVSLVTLVITIVVMVVMISIIINSSIDSIEETNKTKVENEMKDLKNAVIDRIANHERNDNLYPYVGEKIGDSLVDYLMSIESLDSEELNRIYDKISKIDFEKNADNYRLIGKADAEKLGVESIDIENYYIVDYNEGDVYGPVSKKLINNGG